jgi:uncharacterized protein YacL
MAPVPPVDLVAVILAALLNPVVIVVAFWMGRRADQWQKLPVAAFAGACAGALVAYMAARLGLIGATQLDRTPGGVIIAQVLLGLVWAFLGHRFFRR